MSTNRESRNKRETMKKMLLSQERDKAKAEAAAEKERQIR